MDVTIHIENTSKWKQKLVDKNGFTYYKNNSSSTVNRPMFPRRPLDPIWAGSEWGHSHQQLYKILEQDLEQHHPLQLQLLEGDWRFCGWGGTSKEGSDCHSHRSGPKRKYWASILPAQQVPEDICRPIQLQNPFFQGIFEYTGINQWQLGRIEIQLNCLCKDMIIGCVIVLVLLSFSCLLLI